jgi:shikimate dehydrogenase
MQKLYGLIGYTLSHSFSERYFMDKFEREGIKDAEYRLFPIKTIEELPDLLNANEGLVGLNVTIPYKKKVIAYLDHITPAAYAIGAVNTIVITSSGLIGTNTDAYGFEISLQNWLGAYPDQTPVYALVLGTGGAASAVQHVLKQRGITVYLASRSPKAGQMSYAQANELIASSQVGLILQTTPMGMYPYTHELPPIRVDLLGLQHFVFDLIYNPEETLLLNLARKNGAKVKNGLEMLHLQAEGAWQFWNEKLPLNAH